MSITWREKPGHGWSDCYTYCVGRGVGISLGRFLNHASNYKKLLLLAMKVEMKHWSVVISEPISAGSSHPGKSLPAGPHGVADCLRPKFTLSLKPTLAENKTQKTISSVLLPWP